MTIAEFNKVRNMIYNEYVKYLQDKYGLPTKAYYHTTGADNHLTGSNISRGKEGLQCHHVREDIVASLSDKNIAASNLIEYQSPENLCYCNLLEHLFLHILIAEEQKEDENGSYLGDGGVNWMILALNSIYSDPTNSWYSKKIYNPEERGMCYDINNIITNNKDTYLALINRYCTSAFIRIKEDMTPSDIAASLCHTCKKDNNVQAIYTDIMNVAKDTLLFDWNVSAYADLETYLKTTKTALAKICTGGGKTTTGLEYLRVHNCKALVLGSGNLLIACLIAGADLDKLFGNEYDDKVIPTCRKRILRAAEILGLDTGKFNSWQIHRGDALDEFCLKEFGPDYRDKLIDHWYSGTLAAIFDPDHKDLESYLTIDKLEFLEGVN